MGIPTKTMKRITGIVLFAFVCLCGADPSHPDGEEPKRDGKVLPVFQVVKFPNAVCAGATRNGTCYTAEECSSKGGTNDGSCASGFGVCCTFPLSCGGSASENQTYLVQTSVTTLTSPCTYTICPCSTNICRIRYDFETFVLATPTLGLTVEGGDTISTKNEGIGDCSTDRFSIRGSIGRGTPVICGTNTGYHMIMDSGPGETTCQEAKFDIGGTTTTSRSWTIRVTQYACGDHDNSGWPGCLQYYSGTAGTLQSFNFPPTGSVVAATTHLSEQQYDICFRRGSGFCLICYSPTITPGTPAAIVQISFGLSVSSAAIVLSDVGSTCTSDWLEIPGGDTATIAAIAIAALTNKNRFCGRVFTNTDANAITITVCSRQQPFRIGVNFDTTEIHTAETANMAQLGEQSRFNGGIVGFKLTYFQLAC